MWFGFDHEFSVTTVVLKPSAICKSTSNVKFSLSGCEHAWPVLRVQTGTVLCEKCVKSRDLSLHILVIETTVRVGGPVVLL